MDYFDPLLCSGQNIWDENTASVQMSRVVSLPRSPEQVALLEKLELHTLCYKRLSDETLNQTALMVPR